MAPFGNAMQKSLLTEENRLELDTKTEITKYNYYVTNLGVDMNSERNMTKQMYAIESPTVNCSTYICTMNPKGVHIHNTYVCLYTTHTMDPKGNCRHIIDTLDVLWNPES